jgi:hypothetical protein
MANDDDYMPAASAFATVGDWGQVDYTEMNKGITPLFFVVPVQNQRKTEAEGRPVFDEMEQVKILVAGDQYNQVVRPVDDEVKTRFADAYNRWVANKREKHIDGTPLKMWPLLSIGQIAELESLNIFNVEGLANVADSNLTRMYNGREMRTKAQAWLSAAKDGASVAKLATENEQLRADMAELKEQFQALKARRDHDDEEERPRRGRPPKAA